MSVEKMCATPNLDKIPRVFCRLFGGYFLLPRSLLFLAGGALLLNLVNAGFNLILNIYLREQGYPDPQIAEFTSYRFLGVLLFAFPLGLYLKGRPLKRYFVAAAVLIPLVSVLLLHAVNWHQLQLVRLAFWSWGVGFMLLQVSALPFIMRTAQGTEITEAISLYYSTWSLATILAGGFISGLKAILSTGIWSGLHFSPYLALLILTGISTGALWLFSKLEESPPRSQPQPLLQRLRMLQGEYDWGRLVFVLVPTWLIAIGAGLTIPFINLFFFSVFHLGAQKFSMLGGSAAALVFFSALLVPTIRRRFGYGLAILGTQYTAIFFLVVLALTELFADSPLALYVAGACFLLRQPLMNMAGPVTSELTLSFVGPRNQELISALNSSLWSASWFFSARIFQYLRSLEWPYFKIFLLTAALYATGVTFYILILQAYRRQKEQFSTA